MSEIDVEPVDRVDGADEAGADRAAGRPVETDRSAGVGLPAEVDGPEYVLYGGKGGVGKTTMAAATGLASARAGTETLVVSTDPAHSLSDAYEVDVPPEPARIREDAPLYAAEIDPDRALGETPLFDEDGGLAGDLGGLGDLLGDGEGGPLLGDAVPGADEAAAMQQLLAYLDDPRFERVVVDTAPTGHTLRLLALPDVMDTMVGRAVRLRERLQGLMDGVTGVFGGADDADVEDGMDDLSALAERIERLRATLRDPARTDFRVVLVPEPMSVVESRRMRARLREFEIPVGTVVVNRVMEDPAEVAGTDPDAFVTPDLEGCAFCARRWQVQQGALADAQDLFRDHDVRRVPLFADAVGGDEMLRVVAACLA